MSEEEGRPQGRRAVRRVRPRDWVFRGWVRNTAELQTERQRAAAQEEMWLALDQAGFREMIDQAVAELRGRRRARADPRAGPVDSRTEYRGIAGQELMTMALVRWRRRRGRTEATAGAREARVPTRQVEAGHGPRDRRFARWREDPEDGILEEGTVWGFPCP
jgi:hypothetical protein